MNDLIYLEDNGKNLAERKRDMPSLSGDHISFLLPILVALDLCPKVKCNNKKVTPNGSPALVNPINSGIDEQEQNGVTVQSSAAMIFAPIP